MPMAFSRARATAAAAASTAAQAAADPGRSLGKGPVAVALASMQRTLDKRARIGKMRQLPKPAASGSVDFTSNDYLGLARCPELARRIKAEADRVEAVGRARGGPFVGATGSRLLSGTTWYHEEVESWMAGFFQRESALVFNSGYDLNLGLLACLTRPGDAVVFDELVHNSTVMGLRLGQHHHSEAERRRRPWVFQHNDVGDLEARLAEARAALGPQALLFVAVEAIYSMDGDIAPLAAICDAAARQGACVIVDEAHSTGVLGPGGRGLVAEAGLEAHPALLCSIHTFGKAMGCHGAVLCGPRVLRDYCANYCAPFIYSTATTFHSLASMRVACEYQSQEDARRAKLRDLVALFQSTIGDALASSPSAAAEAPEERRCALLHSPTPIQAVLVPGNERCAAVAGALQASGLDVRPLRAPTVPEGKERLRVVLHWHNAGAQVRRLAACLKEHLDASQAEGASAGTGAAAASTASRARVPERGSDGAGGADRVAVVSRL